MQLASFQKTVKVGGLVFGLLLILGVVVYAGRGAANYFAKASGCAAQKVTATNVTDNSVVITWTTEDISQGRVEYGTNATNLTFSAPEAASGKDHNVRLTLLTPNTVYYYLVTIGNNRCDTSGQSCTTSCIPWSFTTATTAAQTTIQQPSPTITPTLEVTVTPTKASTVSATPAPTTGLSAFCQKVKDNVGASSSSTNWEEVKQYDIDSNLVVNGLDVFKCQQSGK